MPTAALLAGISADTARASAGDWDEALAAYDHELGWADRERAALVPRSHVEDQATYERRWEPYLAEQRAHEQRKREALRRLMLTPAPDFEALVVKQSLAFEQFCCREDGDVRRALAADLSRLSRGG